MIENENTVRLEGPLMKSNRQAGQAFVSVALSLVVLTGIVGLAIDMGYLRYTKRRMQTAADGAAIAAASELNGGDYNAAALNDSKANGFENGKDSVTVTAFPPAAPSPFAGTPNYIEVQVQQDAPTFFMRIFGVDHATLSATAVARLGSSKGCVYSLGPVGGINVNATVNAPNCGVVDNALLTIGGGCLNAASIGVVLPLLGGCATPAPVGGIDPSADPLAYLIQPGVGVCTAVGTVINDPNPAHTRTLNPGVYCAGIIIDPNNRERVVFAPGLYILSGGGLQVPVNNPTNLTGDGVTFYVTGGGSIQILGTGNVTLTAPADSPIAGIPGGILFFQDRTNGLNATIENGTLLLTGALYFPSAPLTLGGNGNAPYLILVSQSIQFNGDLAIGTDYSSITGGSPIKSAVLVQ
jgi:Flp pilus assembly protein TadG